MLTADCIGVSSLVLSLIKNCDKSPSVFLTIAYYSEIGTLSLNMAFNSEHSTTVQLTKITLKVTVPFSRVKNFISGDKLSLAQSS